MKHSIIHHLSIEYASDFAALCMPLKKLNITYFAHVRVDASGTMVGVNNHPNFFEHYFENNYFNVDIHAADSAMLAQKYFVLDTFTLKGLSKKLLDAEIAHDLGHFFTILEKDEHGDNYYHFATKLGNSAINQVYINNIDLLELFVAYFKEKMNESKQLQRAYEMKFLLDDGKSCLWESSNKQTLDNNLRNEFLQNIKFNRNVAMVKRISL